MSLDWGGTYPKLEPWSKPKIAFISKPRLLIIDNISLPYECIDVICGGFPATPCARNGNATGAAKIPSSTSAAAALAGNQVIGYTGEGGGEYWKKPIFTEIKTGEIKNFCKEILKKIKTKNFIKISKKQRDSLAENFSLEKEKASIRKFLALI